MNYLDKSDLVAGQRNVTKRRSPSPADEGLL
jgi:hypothetical protein